MVKINRVTFYFITLMILLLPLSSSWKLLLFGTKTKGKVIEYIPASTFGNRSDHCRIRFYAGDNYIDFSGPSDSHYPIGREVTVLYNPKKPEKFVMFNFDGLFLSNKMLFPAVMLIIWIAFYQTVRQNQKKTGTRSRLEEYKHKIRMRKFN